MYKVVIIDDEPWSREVVKALGTWEELQLTVAGEAEDGSVGLRLIGELEPDIVITDMRMPGLEGVELLRTVNERFPLLKIIVMSGYDDFIYMKQAIRSRAIEYLLKPISPEELNRALTECVKELERDREQSRSGFSWKIPRVFSDTAVFNKYLDFRQSIFGHLRELNKPVVLNTFARLTEFLDGLPPVSDEAGLMAKIGYDYMLMLEKFTAENETGFDKIWPEDKRRKLFSSEWISVREEVADIARLYGEVIDAIEAFRKSRNSFDIKEVLAYIDLNFLEAISLETVAQHFFVSKEHLCRTFKAYSGENISDYIIRKRMEKARKLILEKDLAIKNVAQITGYEDIAYFYRVFKRHFGLTPGELRKEE